MVNFLLLLENIIHYSKKDIDKGNTPLMIYKICSSLREAFCLSYAIRKENNFYLYFQKEHLLIKFEGETLRFLGPDERSQALLLNKALNKIFNNFNSLNYRWIKSTPGIYVKTLSSTLEFIEYFNSLSYGKNYLILQYSQEPCKSINLDKNFESIKESDFFIIPTYKIQNSNNNMLEMLKQIRNIEILTLSMIDSIEDKILYINFRKDQQGTL
ncbi:MAG: hypothetical protein ACFE9S_15155 [Candidatus Hermodarchaeota archaeon]